MAQANHSLSPRNKFAKRHYEAIAQAMQEVRMHVRSTPQDQIECVVKILADLFAGDNGEFKRERFERACEPGANVRARS
jgi:hypothetical protein